MNYRVSFSKEKTQTTGISNYSKIKNMFAIFLYRALHWTKINMV